VGALLGHDGGEALLGHDGGEAPRPVERALRGRGKGSAELDGANREGQARAKGLRGEDDGDGAAQAAGGGGAVDGARDGGHGAAVSGEEGGKRVGRGGGGQGPQLRVGVGGAAGACVDVNEVGDADLLEGEGEAVRRQIRCADVTRTAEPSVTVTARKTSD